jgi:hypothetical protein
MNEAVPMKQKPSGFSGAGRPAFINNGISTTDLCEAAERQLLSF